MAGGRRGAGSWQGVLGRLAPAAVREAARVLRQVQRARPATTTKASSGATTSPAGRHLDDAPQPDGRADRAQLGPRGRGPAPTPVRPRRHGPAYRIALGLTRPAQTLPAQILASIGRRARSGSQTASPISAIASGTCTAVRVTLPASRMTPPM